MWLRVKGCADTSELIRVKAREKKVLMISGASFLGGGGGNDEMKSDHVRMSFSLASEADMDEAMRRFRELLVENAASSAPSSKL